MSKELTMAAQQALEACPFCGSTNIKVHSYGDAVIGGEPDAFAQCHDCSVTGPNGKTEAEAAESWNTRALTQRPAAQEVAFCIYPKCLTTGGTCKGDCSKVPAPQQATPDRHLTVTTNQQGEAVMVSWQDAEHRILEVAWERKQATPEPSRGMIGMGSHALANELAQAVAQDDADPDGHDMSAGLFGPNVSAWLRKVATEYLSQPATPEPVGEPVAQVSDLFPSVRNKLHAQGFDPDAPLFTRPAPGVPEGFALVPVERLQSLAKQAHELKARQHVVTGSALLGDKKVKNFGEQQALVYAVACEVGGGLYCLADDLDQLATAQAKGGEA